MSTQTLDGFSEALLCCQKLWPAAEIKTATDDRGWLIVLSWKNANPFSVTLQKNQAGAFAKAGCSWGLSGMSIANSGIDCGVSWENAIKSICCQLLSRLDPVVPCLDMEQLDDALK